jgi:hypothetical protein
MIDRMMMDSDLAVVRSRWAYRLAVVALRMASVGVVAVALWMCAIVLGLDHDLIAKVWLGSSFGLVALATVLCLVAVGFLTSHTSRYVGVTSGSPSPGRTSRLVQSVVQDVLHFRA